MKILHLMADGSTAGGAEHVLGLAKAQIASGLEPLVATQSPSRLAQDLHKIHIQTIPLNIMRNRWNPFNLLQLANTVARTGPDIVHLHGTRAAFYASFFAKRWQNKYALIYTIHGLALRQKSHPLKMGLLKAAEYLACKGATQVISVAQDDLRLLDARGYLKHEKGHHIHNALELERFSPRSEETSKRPPQWPKSQFMIGTVARLVPQKALHIAIEASALLTDTHLLIIGDGPLRTQLEALANKLNAPVTFLGEQSQVETLLPHLDLFVLSSKWEGEPIALLEAIASGLPIVATDNSGAHEILTSSASGVLVEMDNPAALAREIMRLLRAPQRRHQLAQKGLKWISTRSYKNLAKAVYEVYLQALKSI